MARRAIDPAAAARLPDGLAGLQLRADIIAWCDPGRSRISRAEDYDIVTVDVVLKS